MYWLKWITSKTCMYIVYIRFPQPKGWDLHLGNFPWIPAPQLILKDTIRLAKDKWPLFPLKLKRKVLFCNSPFLLFNFILWKTAQHHAILPQQCTSSQLYVWQIILQIVPQQVSLCALFSKRTTCAFIVFFTFHIVK